jgi:hypothetical protein
MMTQLPASSGSSIMLRQEDNMSKLLPTLFDFAFGGGFGDVETRRR